MSQALHPAYIATLNSRTTLPTLAVWAVAFAVVMTKWDAKRHTRRTLKGLTTHELNDIGLSRHQALSEARKPFWQD